MAPSALNLTPEERTAYTYLFAKADTEQIGVLVGEKAVAFFAHSKLPPTILGEIWQLADQDNAGFLTRPQFDIALRLIGKAQRGIPVNQAAISTPGPLCRLDGFAVPGIPTPHSPISSGSVPPVPQSASSIQVADALHIIPEADKVKYTRMFMNAGPKDGLLDGEKARDIFIKSNLSFEKLGQIWTLADTQSRGSLTVGDFSIAMHLIQLCMSGRMSTLPARLPSALLESSKLSITPGLTRALSPQMTGQASHIISHSTGPQRQSALNGSLRPQYTGQTPAASVPAQSWASQTSPASSAFQASGQWDISPAELAQSNVFFDSLDPTRQGFITGDRAVPFMMESKLPGDILAQIWDLADIRGEGQLNRDEFAVAMRLIQDTLAGATESLPAQLPVSMIPPSLRAGRAPPATIPPIQASDTERDLLSLMDDDEPPPAPTPATPVGQISAQNTGHLPQSTPLAVQRTGASNVTPISIIAAPPLAHPGGNLNTQTLPRQLTGQASDFPALDDSGARLGNLHTQVASTETGLAQLRTEHNRLDGDISTTAEQIRTLESKLSIARAAHQTETQLVDQLRTKQAEQRSVLSKLNEEVIRAESVLSALKMEKTEIEGNVLRDKEDIRDMKKKMATLEEQAQQMRIELESLRKDSRLQKGLVAIGKKQVSTSETQRDQVAKELALAQENSTPGVSTDSSSRSLAPLPTSPARLESASSTQKSTNPFANMFTSTPSQLAGQSSSDLTIGHDQEGSVNATDPFGTAFEPSLERPTSAGFGDADGQKKSSLSAFDDAFALDAPSSEPATPVAPSPNCSLTLQSNLSPTDQLSKGKQPEEQEGESSDEDEVEDAVGGKLTISSKIVDRPGSADLKFPPLPDAEFISTRSDDTHNSHRPRTLVAASDAFFSARSDPSEEMFKSPALALQPPNASGLIEPIRSMDAPAGLPPGFGDELEISDFAADFGRPELPKVNSATMEDFDSAFASLPLPSKATGSNTSEKANLPSGFAAFDDAFGDDFVTKPQTQPQTQTQTQTAFDDAFASFDDAFTVQPTGPPSTSKTKELDSLAGSSSFAVPELPPRASSTKADPDLPKDDDSDGVKQICAMGFPRSVAIEALKKDGGNVERALNHLLGT